MDRIIPELKGEEKNTLYIIGNGFDLYHGLKTSYHDFRDWLMSNRCRDFVTKMEILFPTLSSNEYLLWKDFEKAIGKFDCLEIHRKIFQGKDDGFYNEDVFNRPVESVRPVLEDIPFFLKQWLEDIDLHEAPKLLRLSRDSIYLSFNYTLLLENSYAIPERKVMHIHNSLAGDNLLITGHMTQVSEYEADNKCWGANEEESTKLIAREMNKLKKPVTQLIKQHQEFFKSLKCISNIVVFGHSISMIDRPYITEIQKNIQDYTRWYFICKDDEGVAKFQDYVKQYNSMDYYCFTRWGLTESELYKKKMMIENCKYIKTE